MTISETELNAIFEAINKENDELRRATRIDLTGQTKHRIRTEEDDFTTKIDIDLSKTNFSKVLPIQTEMDNTSDLLLFEISTLRKWDKIVNGDRTRMLKENNVMRTDAIMTGKLQVPFQKRKVVTPKFLFYQLRQEGLFSDLLVTRLITHSQTGDPYLVCTTLSKRMSPAAILVGNYIFRLESSDSAAVESEGVCKVVNDGAKILSRTAKLLNFYFDVIQHNAADPIEVIPF